MSLRHALGGSQTDLCEHVNYASGNGEGRAALLT